MNPWQLLGVEPGSDRKTLKRAYTRLLKDVHPEDRPEEFMQLRQAYEWALSTLTAPPEPMRFTVDRPAASPPQPFDWQGSTDAPVVERPTATIDDQGFEARAGAAGEAGARVETQPVAVVSDPGPDPDPGPGPDHSSGWDRPAITVPDTAARQQRLGTLAVEMESLLGDPEQRNDLSRWEALLMSPDLNDLDASASVSAWLLPRVIRLLQSGEAKCPLRPRVLIRLDDRFQWTAGHGGALPVLDDQLMRLCVLIESARESITSPRRRLGIKWLAETLFLSGGRLSRIEFLLGLAVTMGLVVAGLVLEARAAEGGLGAPALMLFVLLMAVSGLFMFIKRVRDTGVHPWVAVLLGAIFPISPLYYLFAAPSLNNAEPDPRLKYYDVFDLAYRDYYVADRKRTWGARIYDRLTGYHPVIYLLVPGIWAAVFLLLS